MTYRTHQRRSPSVHVLVAVMLAVATVRPGVAQVHGLSYTLSPTGEQVFFDGNAGLENGLMYGGEAGFGFGRFIELEGQYLRGGRMRTDFSELSGISDEMREVLLEFGGRPVDLQRYGGALRVNIPAANVIPFVTIGGGIQRLEPEHLNPTRSIYVGVGGGLQFSAGGRYALTLSAQRFGYRTNLGATFFDELDLAELGLAPGSFRQTYVYNWAARAGLKIYVGGRTPAEETALDEALRRQFSGGGLSFSVEPHAATLAFDERLGFRDRQALGGVYAGVDLGPFVGVRGFYWRGLGDGIFDFEPIQAYGGELRFELTSGPSLAPYLVIGGGYLDVLDGYRGRDGTRPDDEPFLIAGVGAVLPINEALALNAGARAVLTSREGAHNVIDPGDVVSSWMFSGGLAFGVGRGRPGLPLEIARERDPVYAQLEEVQARIDSLARVIEALREEPVLTDRVETVRAARPADRMVTLPLPEEGELYVRFGTPGGVTIESTTGEPGVSTALGPQALSAQQIEQIVRQTVREQLRESEEAIEGIDRIDRVLQERIADLEARFEDRLRLLGAPPPTLQVEPPQPVVVTMDARPARPRSILPFVAFMSGTPDMFMVGGRLDARIGLLGPVHLLPELAFGAGGGTYAYHMNLDAVVTLGFLEWIIEGFRPYVGGGGGVLGFNERPGDAAGVRVTGNLRMGSEFLIPWGRFFTEFATFDWFTYNRFAAGYVLRF